MSADRDGLLVDTGAVNSLTGDEFAFRVAKRAKSHGHGSQFSALDRNFEIEGVGKGANVCEQRALLPIALEDGSTGTFTSPMIRNSEVPGLLGLNPVIKARVLLDLVNLKFITVGEGGFDLKLSAGSTVRPCLLYTSDAADE